MCIKKLSYLHDFKVCTNTHLREYFLMRYEPHMFIKDSHLKDYDKFFCTKMYFCTLTEFYRTIHPYVVVLISYHSLTLIVQLVSYCYIRIRARTRKLLRLCTYLVAKAEEPTPSLCLWSMDCTDRVCMCSCLIYSHCVDIPCTQIVNTSDILYADVLFVNYYKTNYISYAHPLMDDTNISTNIIVHIMSIMSFVVSVFILVFIIFDTLVNKVN